MIHDVGDECGNKKTSNNIVLRVMINASIVVLTWIRRFLTRSPMPQAKLKAASLSTISLSIVK